MTTAEEYNVFEDPEGVSAFERHDARRSAEELTDIMPPHTRRPVEEMIHNPPQTHVIEDVTVIRLNQADNLKAACDRIARENPLNDSDTEAPGNEMQEEPASDLTILLPTSGDKLAILLNDTGMRNLEEIVAKLRQIAERMNFEIIIADDSDGPILLVNMHKKRDIQYTEKLSPEDTAFIGALDYVLS